ncbi:MAG: MFS transporter, partial [Promethearchaeota archaeon]
MQTATLKQQNELDEVIEGRHDSVSHKMKYGIILLAFLFATMDQSIMMILASWIPLISSGSSTAYSLSSSFLYLGNLVFAIPSVKLSQKKGHRITLSASFCCSLLGMTLLLLASSLWVVYLARFLMGLNALLAVITHAIHANYSDEKIGSPLALYSAGYIGGNVVGSLVGNTLIGSLGFYGAIAILFTVYIGVYLSIWMFFPNDSPQKSSIDSHTKSNMSFKTQIHDQLRSIMGDTNLIFYMV